MKREILINAGARETRVAILEDEKLVELLVDRPDNRRMVGDVYLGKVDAVLPGIQAAFIDIGMEKSAFLHASDLVRENAEEAEDDDDDDDHQSESVNGSAGRNGDEAVQTARRGSRRSSKAPPIQDSLKRGQETDLPGPPDYTPPGYAVVIPRDRWTVNLPSGGKSGALVAVTSKPGVAASAPLMLGGDSC